MATPAKQPPSGDASKTPVKPKAGRIRRACRRLYKLVTSHLGLIAFLVAFSFVGAAIFQAIEGDNEKDEKADIQWLREQIISNLWNASAAVKRNEQAFRLLMRHELKKYEAQLYAAFGEGINTSADEEVWDFWGSLFYCATVYTTIGYGNIFPATDIGRVVTIIYSLIGIPLCLIVLADLGKLFTRAIKWVWSFVRRFYYTRRFSRAAAKKVAEERAEKARVAATAVKQGRQDGSKTPTTAQPVEPVIPVYVVDDEFNLPVSVAVFITFAYILLGALIYRQWEDWSYLEAFYFVFISISTIGFGDVLPAHPKYFLLSSVYVLVGLSLVAMVINVIMEALTIQLDNAQRNIAEIARTVGIGIDEEEDTTTSAAPNGLVATPQGTTPVVTPAPSISTLNAAASQVPVTPSSAQDVYASPLRDDPQYSGGDRGRPLYRDSDLRYREPHQDYRSRQDDYYRGRPDDYRGRPDDYRSPVDYRGPPDYNSPDPWMADRSPDRRMGDPRYADPRGDPRYDPRSPADSRTDPRFGDPRSDLLTQRSASSYGPQTPQGRPEFLIS